MGLAKHDDVIQAVAADALGGHRAQASPASTAPKEAQGSTTPRASAK